MCAYGPSVPTYREEMAAHAAGYASIAGIDEVGVGCLAGPVVAAAIVFSADPQLPVNDSKQLTERQREELVTPILTACAAFAIGIASAQEIDCLNIYRATERAMRRALAGLSVQPDFLLIDGKRALTGCPLPQKTLIKGDQKVCSIAAASIVAKVFRDRWMHALSNRYPQYGFHRHKGYGTQGHYAALLKWGATSIHRLSFLSKLPRLP